MRFWFGCLLTWNFVSTLMTFVSISFYGSASCDTSAVTDVGSVPLHSDLRQDVSLDDNNRTDTNHSGEVEGLEVTNCTVDESESCGSNLECKDLNAYCIDCEFNYTCHYGSTQKTVCTAKPSVNCTGDRRFEKEYECTYCYQLDPQFSWCSPTMDCALNKPRNFYPARPQYISTCWTRQEHLCLGRRCFYKQRPCNWSNGYKWSTAMLLSIFLGGFGFDRFYLGLWQHGIGKLLSFGGLGVWTLVDVILIGVGYVGPWDGSLYI